ncbi:MAG: flagellar hook-basal body complex protein FliE [Deltaproteobacteria bacterium]|nr:flagellar hook-basal body complex protein FliE [Deltaproteobacteria bacterium]
MKEIAIQKNIETSLSKSSIGRVNQLSKEADQAVQALATGQETDIHGTMIAIEKASISFQLMMQTRNKIIDAYKEITRMSV